MPPNNVTSVASRCRPKIGRIVWNLISSYCSYLCKVWRLRGA